MGRVIEKSANKPLEPGAEKRSRSAQAASPRMGCPKTERRRVNHSDGYVGYSDKCRETNNRGSSPYAAIV